MGCGASAKQPVTTTVTAPPEDVPTTAPSASASASASPSTSNGPAATTAVNTAPAAVPDPGGVKTASGSPDKNSASLNDVTVQRVSPTPNDDLSLDVLKRNLLTAQDDGSLNRLLEQMADERDKNQGGLKPLDDMDLTAAAEPPPEATKVRDNLLGALEDGKLDRALDDMFKTREQTPRTCV